MKFNESVQTIKIPDGVTVNIKSRLVIVKGPHGELQQSFKHLPVEISMSGRTVYVKMFYVTRKLRASIRTVCSRIQNMVLGVTKIFQYKMRIVYNHFPINVNVVEDGSKIEIRNFMGEKRVRIVDLTPGVTVTKSKDVKDELVLNGIDVDAVSGDAALIHQRTLVRGKDIRIFLDGIYVSEKSFVQSED